MSIIYSVLLLIDGVIYDFICYIYEIFYALADINIFSDTTYDKITTKLYVILGLVMMFALAYSLLKAVINPDDYAKGEQSINKLIPNVIISLAIIVVLPTVFEFAMNFQHAVLTSNTIYDFILSDGEADSTSTAVTVEPGRETAFYTFSAFFYPSEEFCSSEDGGSTTDLNACKEKVLSNGGKWYWPPSWGNEEISLAQLDSSILSGEASFRNYTQFSDAVAENEASYTLIVSTVAGIFILYVLLNFCFDMAVRVIKLAFYQLIAPIPVICRILPGGKFKDTFNTWVKQIVSIYLEVFIRIFIMALSVFLIDLVVDYMTGTGAPNINSQLGNIGFVQRLIIQALLIMAVIIFMKQAPKLIGDLFKLDTGGMKLGLMDKLAMGGALTAGAVAGGGLTAGARNAVAGYKNFKDTKGQGVWARTKAVGGAVTSTVAGVTSGAARSGKAGLKAKNFKDMAGAATAGATAAVTARVVRDAKAERYKANDKNTFTGRVTDFVDTAKEWAGIYDVEGFKADNKIIDDINARKKAVRTSVEGVIDGEANKASSSFSYGGYSATELRQKMLDIQNARAGTLRDANGNAISVSQAQQAYDEYRFNFSQALQNATLSQSQYEAISDTGVKAKLAEANAEAQALKVTLSRNLDKDYVKNSGFTKDNVMGDLSVSGGPLKDIGDRLDLKKAQNNAEISKLERQKAEKAKEKKQ